MVPSGGVILSKTTVTFYEGESVFDVLQRVCKEKGIHMEASWTPIYNSAYVEGMTLRFIPKFKAQMDAVVDAQRNIGRDISQGSLWHRTKIAITVLSIMVTWALENAIETADSMKSRGYGYFVYFDHF